MSTITTNQNANIINLTYAPFVPTEVKVDHRKNFYTQEGLPKYVVEADPDTRKYVRHRVRLITDPEWYSRNAYILYKSNQVEDMQWLQTSGYLVDKLDFVQPDRIMQILD